MKLCLIINGAAHYRDSIYKLIDESFDCVFWFGTQNTSIKQIDTSNYNGTVNYSPIRTIKRPWIYQTGVIWQGFDRSINHYLLLGETHSISTWLFCIVTRLFCPHKKIYFWSHGWYGKESRIEKFIKKIFFRLPNGGTFLYGNYARELMIKEGFDPNKLFTIHNSLSYSQQLSLRKTLKPSCIYQDYFGNSNPVIIFLGRLTQVKQLDLLIDAVDILKKKGECYNVVLVGDGPVKCMLQTRVEELGLTDSVWFYGACYDETTNAELVFNADVCVAPGNIGLTAMHSMVFGTPCISHNDFKRQMPEFEAIRDGETGSFFERNNANSLSDSISRWFQTKSNSRNDVREACYNEIDSQWNPIFQIEIFKKHIK